jgi:hypothetical protein
MLPLVQGRMQENFAALSVVRGQLSVARKTEDRRQPPSPHGFGAPRRTEGTRQYALGNKHYVKLVINLLG